jgi:hypothetical protein
MKKIGGLCSLEDCDRPFYGKSLCRKHYDQQRNLDKDRLSAQNRKYYAENRESILESKKSYRESNKEVSRRGARARRARKKGSTSKRYLESEVIGLYGSNCHICSEPIDLDAPRRTGLPGWERGLHIDHVESLCVGGEDTIDNVRPSHGKCNLTKKRRK